MTSQSLTVGLAVGIPSFVIISFVLILWLRNQRKQKLEAQAENDYDLGLRDDHSFDHFQHELVTPYVQTRAPVADPNKSTSTTQATESGSAEKPYISSNGSSTSTTTIDHHTPGSLHPPRAISNRSSPIKPASAYDFYDTFIPVMRPASTPNTSNQGNASGTHPNNSHSSHLDQPHSPHHDLESSTNNSSNSISLVGREKSLDNLAKQLTAPTYFEKLPSRAATVALKHRPPGPHYAITTNNNSSSDLVGLTMNEHSTINDNFVYEASKIEDDSHKDLPKIPKAPKSTALSSVLGGHIDNSFDKDAGIATTSPFKDETKQEELEPAVVFQ